ncbi:MAG: hypothetical protein J0L93_04160 [Deltaproteobacteria bacterium]|nr:hypothetical protein [Deltaproteobacteria bacterium]
MLSITLGFLFLVSAPSAGGEFIFNPKSCSVIDYTEIYSEKMEFKKRIDSYKSKIMRGNDGSYIQLVGSVYSAQNQPTDVREYQYGADKYWRKTVFYKAGKISKIFIPTYSPSSGYPLGVNTYDDKNTLIEATLIKRDSKNRGVEETITTYKNGAVTDQKKILTSYNDDLHQVTSNSCMNVVGDNVEGTEQQDSEGRTLLSDCMIDKVLRHRGSQVYSDKGVLLISEAIDYDEHGLMSHSSKMFWDEDGIFARYEEKIPAQNIDEVTQAHTKKTYNEKNLLSKTEVELTFPGNASMKYDTEFSYDAKDRVTKEISTHFNSGESTWMKDIEETDYSCIDH